MDWTRKSEYQRAEIKREISERGRDKAHLPSAWTNHRGRKERGEDRQETKRSWVENWKRRWEGRKTKDEGEQGGTRGGQNMTHHKEQRITYDAECPTPSLFVFSSRTISVFHLTGLDSDSQCCMWWFIFSHVQHQEFPAAGHSLRESTEAANWLLLSLSS